MSEHRDSLAKTYGLLARFADSDSLLQAARAAHDDGYRRLDAFAPYPVEGLAHALGHDDNRVPRIALICAVAGALVTLAVQVYATQDYAFNVGGKPILSWPAFAVPTFAVGMLGATFGALIAMIALNRLPQPYHPLFNAASFDRASHDTFFLCIEAGDRRFDPRATHDFLLALGAEDVIEVAP